MSSPTPPASNQAPSYPEPYIIKPTLPHKNTLILLHGTSTTGPTFAATILSFSIPIVPLPSSTSSSASSSPSTVTLTTLFPSTKLIFPTGSPRYVTVLKKPANAWFDMHSFDDRTVGEEAQVEGLRESVLYLGQLIRREVQVVKREGRGGRVVLVGFSQGCAVGVVGVLSGEFGVVGHGEGEGREVDDTGIVGCVGLSGWLPFRRNIDDILSRISMDPSKDKAEKQASVVKYIRDRLGLDVKQSGSAPDRKLSLDIPMFLCHGKDDQKMKVEWGWEMARTLISARMRVWFTEYNTLEHWYGEQEMVDVVRFLRLLFEKGKGIAMGEEEHG